jgi:hypothetical protein
MAAHRWILIAVSEDGKQWADWACARCKQKILAAPGSDPNADNFVWSIQGAYECDDQLIKDVMIS